MAERPDADCRFKTDTATLAVFDPSCLRHRALDDADWWSVPDEEVAEINSGNVLFVGLGVDGVYSCDVYRDQDDSHFAPNAVTALLRTEVGCFYFGAGEEVPAGEIGPDTRYGGVLMSVPRGTWRVAVSRKAADQIIVRLASVDLEPKNDFTDSPLLVGT